MRIKLVIWALFTSVVLGCGLVRIIPDGESLPTEIEEGDNVEAPAPVEEAADQPEPTSTPVPTFTPTPAPTPTPTVTPFFLARLSLAPPNAEICNNDYECQRRPPRHGLLIALVLPLFILGIPWVIAEFFVVRFVQPKGLDLSEVLIKAQDGLFVLAIVSLTARRSVTLAASRASWSRVAEFVEKDLEQELLHQAIGYKTLEDLEKNMKHIADSFKEMPIIQELSTDFGVEVMRFNIETRYPQETMDALNRKAEAAAGGHAYLAYAAAAHLDPDSRESRELYRIYQETQGQVDAARNLGGGLTSIAGMFAADKEQRERNNDDE